MVGERAYHSCICLAEGLTELGILCYSDFTNYRTGIDKDFLMKFDEDHPMTEADIVFIHYTLYDRIKNADEQLLRINQRSRKYITVFIDDSDGLRTPGFRKGAQNCDYVLKSHYNRKYAYPENFCPWQFGVTKRILNAVNPLPFEEREVQILVNFRIKHQLRDYVNQLIEPIVSNYLYWSKDCKDYDAKDLKGNDLLFWQQTGGRHYPEYYDRLSFSMACACYGGVFSLPVGNYNKYTAKITRVLNDIIHLYEWDRVRQWDSWRLWEAWAAACCVVHVDLEKYGCVLPVMPVNGKHYIGIDIKYPDKLEELLNLNAKMPKDSSILGEIAVNGREFVLENYAPKKVAERLLTMIGY